MKEARVRVTTSASRNEVKRKERIFYIKVTCIPESGKANKEVQRLLSKYLGIPKTRLTLVRGVKSRDKIFKIDE